MKTKITAFIIDALLFVAAYFALFQDVTAARNVLIFYGAFSGFMGTVLFLSSVTKQKIAQSNLDSYRKRGKLWSWYDAATDIAMILIFVSVGWWFTAVFLCVWMFGKRVYYTQCADAIAKQDAEAMK